MEAIPFMTWKPIKIVPQHTFMQSTNGDNFEFVRMKYTLPR
ncbi:hypothetical protein [Paenibacillus dendritiformis]